LSNVTRAIYLYQEGAQGEMARMQNKTDAGEQQQDGREGKGGFPKRRESAIPDRAAKLQKQRTRNDSTLTKLRKESYDLSDV
jgi:hypothetical protein